MNRALTAAGSSSVIAMIDQAYTCTRSGDPSGPISPASGYRSATASTIAVDSNSVAPSSSVSAGTRPSGWRSRCSASVHSSPESATGSIRDAELLKLPRDAERPSRPRSVVQAHHEATLFPVGRFVQQCLTNRPPQPTRSCSQRAFSTMPAATVSLVDSSIRMKLPVERLRA